MVFFAALTFVGFRGAARLAGAGGGQQAVFWLAFLLAFVAMVVLGIATERIVLRRWSISPTSRPSWPPSASPT